jgi:hypothetical protein
MPDVSGGIGAVSLDPVVLIAMAVLISADVGVLALAIRRGTSTIAALCWHLLISAALVVAVAEADDWVAPGFAGTTEPTGGEMLNTLQPSDGQARFNFSRSPHNACCSRTPAT